MNVFRKLHLIRKKITFQFTLYFYQIVQIWNILQIEVQKMITLNGQNMYENED